MEKENKSVKTNKKSARFILILLIFMLVVLYVVYNIGLKFEPVTVIEYEGFAVSGKELAENLLRPDLNATPYIDAIKIQENDAIYKKIATYYVGEEKKTKINLDYPIYINQNIALLNMSEESKLITTNFEEVEGYKNSTLTDGGLYNLMTLDRADYNDYLFLKNSDNVFINSKQIEIKTNVNKYVIPKNSIISFSEEYVAYYTLNEGTFEYNSIIDIELDSVLLIENTDYIINVEKGQMEIESSISEHTYEELLTKLNLIKKSIIKDDVEANEIKDEMINEEDNVINNNEQDNSNNSDNTNQDVKPPEKVWIKPNVTATDFEAGVYTANTKLSIYDPSGEIKTAITFEIFKNGKIYMRNQAVSSGNLKLGVLEPNTEYEIRGIYRYSNKEEKTIEVEFINQKIKTKNIDELKPLKLSFENGNIYSNKIQIANLKIASDFNEVAETLIGIKSVEIKVNDKSYALKISELRKLLNGIPIVCESQENLKSNSEVNFEIQIYDVANNLVKLENNIGKTKTCMRKPEMTVELANKKLGIDVSLKTTLKNHDKVEIKNMNYVVYSVDNQIVDKGAVTSDIIKPQNIELAKYYSVKVYGDYDLNDNRGMVKDNLLGETNFTTSKIESFGDLYIDLFIETENIQNDSVNIKFNINNTVNKTQPELVQMLKDASVVVYRQNEVIQRNNLDETDFNTLINYGTVELKLDRLDSNTYYTIKIEATAVMGNTQKQVNAIINGTKNFTTLKKEAQINIKNLYVLNDMIDFDLNVYDKDQAIRSSKATLEVISTRDEVVYRNVISASEKTNENTRIQITNLSSEEKYYLSITTDRYSVRQEESTIKQKAFEFNGNEARITNELRKNQNVGVVWTNNVGGKITLEKIEKKPSENNKNLVDVESNVNWYSECFNTNKGYLKEYDSSSKTLKLGVGKSTSQIYVYDLITTMPNYNGEELEIYFKYKKSNSNLKVYLQNGTDFTNNKVLELTSENTTVNEQGWTVFDSKDISDTITTSQYMGLLLEGNADTYIQIRDFQVKLKEEESDEILDDSEESQNEESNEYKFKFTSKFKLNLNLYDDSEKTNYENNIITQRYYIRLRNKTSKKTTEILYKDYIEKAANDKGKNINSIEDLIVNLDLEQNQQYEVMLVLKHDKVEGREYILSKIEVDTTLSEIKNISSISDYLKIQPNGNYIFSNDLDLDSGDYKFGNENLYFNGTLDFNGKKIKRKIELKEDSEYKYYLFYGFSEEAEIKNLYFDFYINLITEEGRTDTAIASENSGLVYENRGTISNLIVNLASSTNSPNEKFAIIGYHNSGTLENFAIYLKANFYLGGTGALGFVNCVGGTIKNGYMAPYPNTSYCIKPLNCNDYLIRIAGLTSYATSSEISNIYSLVTINNNDDEIDSLNKEYMAGNILAELTDSTVKNIYSVDIGNITINNSKNKTIGPTIFYPYDVEDKNNVENSYFFYDEIYNNNEYNTKVNVAALSNQEFQENLLNNEGSDKKFIINSTINDYFPQIELPEFMPAQLKIPMKKTLETEADVLSVEILNDGELEKTVEFTVFNPRESKIDKIEIDGLEVDEYRIHSEEYCNSSNPFEKCKGHDNEGYCLDSVGNRIKVEGEGYTQNYLSGQTTKLITRIRIPTSKQTDLKGFDSRKYASVYCMKSIRAKGFAEKVYIKDDGTEIIRNELKLIYYYQVSNIDDWKRIKEYPDENYKIITSELDFGNTQYSDYCITSTFSGILDGEYANGKIATIKNVGKVGVEVKNTLFYKLNNAQLLNIIIDGFVQNIDTKNVTENAYITGLIGKTTTGTVIKNVHIKNAKITTKAVNKNSDVFYIGGLVANTEDTTIENCSISYRNDEKANISDINGYTLSSATIGGLVGNAQETKILNCFVKDIFVNVKIGTSNGIGGIVGRFTGEIIGCYSIGQVKTNTQNIGGIFGRTLETKKYVDRIWTKEPNVCNNCYSVVNIKTDSTNIGGIGGFATTSVISEITDNISIGNLYTSMAGSNTNSNRVIGNISSTTYTNYAYAAQLINGFKVSSKDSNYKRGAKYVVEKESMLNNYNNMFNEEYYETRDLTREFLPRLKYKDSSEILPNQEILKRLPENPTLEIKTAKENNGKIKIEIKDENTPHVESTNINLEIANFSDLTIEKREYNESTKMHTLYLTGKPIYYLDSYEITKIMYENNSGEEYSAEVAVKVDYLQYKEIASVEDWAKEFCPEYTRYNYSKVENDGKPEFLEGQNYKITGDIKLSDLENLNGETLKVPTNLVIGRLIANESNRATISDFSITTRGSNIGIFNNISKELKNINFKDIYIKNTSGNYTGIIVRSTAQQIANMDFENITIEAASSYSGIIADSTCTKISNIKLENIKCTGSSYVGGFIGRTYPGTIKNITANNIQISATGNYSGGIFGYMYAYTGSYGGNITDFTITNSKITSKGEYVSGIVGYGAFKNNAKVENVSLESTKGKMGGVIGQQSNSVTSSNIYIKDLTIKCTSSGSYIGGATGYNHNSLNNVYIYGLNIQSNGGNYVGSISGHGGSISDSAVEGYVKEDGTAYNTINASNVDNVGGITGYTWGSVNRAYVRNIDITGRNYVGGIVGRIIEGSVINSFNQDCTVYGNTNVGGILGGYTTNSTQRNRTVLQIYNTYNNATITAKSNTAGGIIGYLDNSKTNNQSYRLYIYRNYVANSEINTNTNAGSLIGRIVNPLYYLNNTTKYYYGNLIVTNVDEEYPIGNINNIIEKYTKVDLETQEEIVVTRVVPPEETMSRLFNSIFYKYDIEYGEKVLEESKLNRLKLQNTYTDTLAFGNNNSNFKFDTSIISTQYPLLQNNVNKTITYLDGTTKQFTQTGIKLPGTKQNVDTQQVSSIMSLFMRNTLPEYKIYVSDVNKINIEFTETPENTYFRYEYNGVLSDKILLENRVYTFEYDLVNPFTIIVLNNDGQSENTIMPNDIKNKVSIVDGRYCYLQDKNLKVNLDTIQGEFVNIFEGKALTSDGYVYDISSETRSAIPTQGLNILNESIPLAESVYSGNIIETYYNFSKVISQESENISEFQMFIKNNRLFVLDGGLDIYADSVIINAYNNNEYQTVLGTDGVIYDLKTAINYPKDFVNEKIVQMTNNINSDSNEILIMYEDGRVYAFNYINGSVSFDTKQDEENLLTTVGNTLTSLFSADTEALYEPVKEEYKEAMELQEILEKTPISNAEAQIAEGTINTNMENVESNTTAEHINSSNEQADNVQSNTNYNENETSSESGNSSSDISSKEDENDSYVTVYDSSSNTYLVYKESTLLKDNNKEEEVISETEKINLDPALKEFYQTAKGSKTSDQTKGVYLIVISIVTIGIILIVMYKKKNYA